MSGDVGKHVEEKEEEDNRDAEGQLVRLNYDQDTNKGERAIKVIVLLCRKRLIFEKWTSYHSGTFF